MGAKGKKGKKGKKGGGKKKKDADDGEPKIENPLFKNSLPSYGWIRVELKLCDPPFSTNFFTVLMRSNQGVMEIM